MPIFASGTVIITVLGGSIFFQEFRSFCAWQYVAYFAGLVSPAGSNVRPGPQCPCGAARACKPRERGLSNLWALPRRRKPASACATDAVRAFDQQAFALVGMVVVFMRQHPPEADAAETSVGESRGSAGPPAPAESLLGAPETVDCSRERSIELNYQPNGCSNGAAIRSMVL